MIRWISGIFEFSDRPGNSSLVKMIMADKGFLHDILLFIKQHQDRELTGRKTQRPDPLVEKDEPPPAGNGYQGPKRDLSGDGGSHMHQ